MPASVVLLNQRRQIVAANAALLRTLNAKKDEVIGKRPGEVLRCIHAHQGPDGCGTAESCAFCDAVNTVLESQRSGGQVAGEARILRKVTEDGGAMDVRITATKLDVDGEILTVAALEDISQHKRLGVFTRIFFHDVMNIIAGLRSFVHLLGRKRSGRRNDTGHLDCLNELADQLAEEIEAQRDLMLAESGDLIVEPQVLNTADCLKRLRALYAAQEAAAGHRIVVEELWDGALTSDPRLLARVLGNMLQNALEATESGGTVTIGCRKDDDRVAFSVHNDAVMPKDVQMQMFQRSFTTKGALGRGIGTHSIKLFGERYLHGKVGFSSRDSEGTTFWIELPETWPEEDSPGR
jgi:signal transduction histidine kinase